MRTSDQEMSVGTKLDPVPESELQSLDFFAALYVLNRTAQMVHIYIYIHLYTIFFLCLHMHKYSVL